MVHLSVEAQLAHTVSLRDAFDSGGDSLSSRRSHFEDVKFVGKRSLGLSKQLPKGELKYQT